MKASLMVMKEGRLLVDKEESAVRGMRLPYMSRGAVPVFVLDTEEPWDLDMIDGLISAPPGMVGFAQHGDNMYVIDAEGNAQQIPFVVISEREHERCKLMGDSFRRETV